MSYKKIPIKNNGSIIVNNVSDLDFTGLATVTGTGVNSATIDITASANDLSDVNITTPSDGQVLFYNSTTTQWENTTLLVPGQGKLLQVQFGPIPTVSGTATIPSDGTVPLITEGVEIWSQTITPSDNGSKIRIGTSIAFAVSNAASSIVVAIFRNNTCVGVMTDTAANKDAMQTVSFTVYDLPGTTASLTYSARVGRSSGNATWYVNADPNQTNQFGGTLEANAYTVEEIAV